jgi:hypothetical protein
MVAGMDISGRFLARRLSPGSWLLTRTQPPQLEIFLQGVELEATSLAGCEQLKLEWQASGVVLRLCSATQNIAVSARGATVHEPRPRLYEGLPLADFDAATQRFWRRIFRVVRIPGGRYLLRMLARGAESSG